MSWNILKKSKNKKFNVKKYISKSSVVYLIVMLLDAGLVIYCARNNIVNYVKIEDKEIIVGGLKRLLFGKNYITLIITFFFYLYICLLNILVFKDKKKERFYVLWFLLIIMINILLFMVFSRKIY